MLRAALLASLLLLAAPALAFHQPGDCPQSGSTPICGSSTICVLHVNENAPPGSDRTEVTALYATLFGAWQAGAYRASVGSLTDVNQYAFVNSFGSGNGTRAYSDTGLWVFQGNNVQAGAYYGLGARQFDIQNRGGTDARVEAGGYLPVLRWHGVGLYYAQSYGANGSCSESLVLAGAVGGVGVWEPLVGPSPCVVQNPRLPNVVQP
jgi:hypothetical protein